MRIKLLIFTSLLLFFGASSAFAGEPPIHLSPSNNSTVTSSKLQWQIPSYSLYTGGSYYMVQVDDQAKFTNPEKNNIYLSKNYYTPKLNPGTWYWRVQAKDSAGSWSGWSEGWSFTLNATSSTPSPTPSAITSSSPTPSPTSSSHSSSFTISNIPSHINSDQSFNISVAFSFPNNPNTIFYLKGAFKRAETSNYFGLTKVGSSWVKNGVSYSDQYKITTDSSGAWFGAIEVKPDSEDSGFTGSGDYIFKVGKYNAADANPSVSWSNESTIKIISVETESDQGETLTNTSSPTVTSSDLPPSIKTKARVETATHNQPKKYDRLVYNIASVAAATTSSNISATHSAAVSNNQKQTSPMVWVGLIFIFAGASSIGYLYLKKNAKIRF